MAKEKKNVKKKKEKQQPEGFILVNAMEEWLQRFIPKDFADNDFMQIILFYVLYSPCKKGSYSRKDLEKYGWKNPWHYDDFKTKLKQIAGFDDNNWNYIEAQKNFKELWESLDYQDEFFNIENNEFVVFSNVGETNPFLDLFHHIRNSLAHGRFTAKKVPRKKDYLIYMEDVHPESGLYKVNARMIIKKSTLLEWAKFLQCETEEAKKLCQDLFQRNTTNGKPNANLVSRN